MKSALTLAISLLAAPLLLRTAMGAEVDAKLLRVISPGTALIYGIDVERYQNSRFSEFYPVRLDETPGLTGIEGRQTIRQIIIATEDLQSGRTLTMFQSASPLTLPRLPEGSDALAIAPYHGVPILPVQGMYLALLDKTVGVAGAAEDVHQAIDRWNQNDGTASEIAAQVQRLSRSYDNWFLAIKPLVRRGETPAGPVLKHREEFVQMIEEARGGIRLGGSNEVNIEVVVKTADDAVGLAAIGRWLPGLIQMNNSGVESALADLADNLAIRTAGRVVSLSCWVAESKLDELVKSRNSRNRRVVE